MSSDHDHDHETAQETAQEPTLTVTAVRNRISQLELEILQRDSRIEQLEVDLGYFKTALREASQQLVTLQGEQADDEAEATPQPIVANGKKK